MEALIELRRLARERRDKAIAIATQRYQATLTRIAEIELDLIGQRCANHKRTSNIIGDAIPKDRPFTTLDVMAALEAMDPARSWYMRSVTNHIGRLRRIGMIRRIRRPTKKQNALYVYLGVESEPTPFGDKTTLD
ncbi:MAG TPA: hypothetical protein VGJ15_07635, partial [Pirellulales bacterium]